MIALLIVVIAKDEVADETVHREDSSDLIKYLNATRSRRKMNSKRKSAKPDKKYRTLSKPDGTYQTP
jgi:hypothetical protein